MKQILCDFVVGVLASGIVAIIVEWYRAHKL